MPKKKNKSSKKKSPKKERKKRSSESTVIKVKQELLPSKSIVSDYFEQTLRANSLYLLLGLLCVMTLIVFGTFWFTDNIFLFKDIGSDSINIFYPNYYWNAETWEQEGVFPSWSFATGLGQDIMLGSKGDPFIWLLYLTGKDSIIEGLAYIEALKVVLSGICFYAYLRTMRIAYLASVCGGLIYAFSGFMILGSGWFVFTIEGLYFAMMLLAFERFLLLGKWAMFPFVLMLVSMSQPLDVYIMGVLIGTYGTVRILLMNNFNWKNLGIKYLQLIGLGFLALAMGAILFLPSIDLMLNSPRVLGESNFFATLQSKAVFDWVDPNLWATTKARLFSTNLLVDNSYIFKGAMNYLEAPAIYCGLGTLILAPQAFIFFTKKERILYGSLFGLYLLPLVLPYFRYTFWLFAGDYFRFYSLFVIFIIIFLCIKSIHFIFKEDRFSWLGLGLGSLGAFYLLFSVVNTEIVVVNESTRSFLYLLLFFNVIVIAGWSIKVFRPVCSILFLVLLCLDLISVAKPTLNDRSIATAREFTTDKVGYNDYTVDAIKYIKSIDNSFHRVEKFQYHSGLAIHNSINDAKVQGYKGSKSYHSFNQLNYIRFLGALDVIDQTNENHTRWAPGVGSRQLLSMLVSNKYVLTKTGSQKPMGVGYKFLKTFGDVSIFQNQNFLPFGFTYDKMILRSDFDKIEKNRISKDITLLKSVVIENDNEEIISKLEKFDTLNINPSKYTELTLSEDVKNRKQEAFQLSSFSNSKFSGSITLSKDKMLFFSMPLDKGWTAIVDNKKTKIHRVNVGFSGLMLTSGTHTIELKYETPYFLLGKWISIFSFLFYGLCFWWAKKKSELNVGSE